jgi:signal transduction histidine kinase
MTRPPHEGGAFPPSDPDQRLERAERLLAFFRRTLNHDLPNHLVAIQGLLQIVTLEEADRLSPAGREYVQRLVAAAARTHALVRGLAAIGRVGGSLCRAEPIPFAEVAREAIAEVNQLFPARAIEYHLEAALPTLTLPRAPLQQVLVQLLRNAVQAASDRVGPRITVGARATPTLEEFWVADNGRGLSAEQQQQLQEFFTGQDKLALGGGLGLVLVRQIVEWWGGSLRVQSTPGQGSVFTVTAAAAPSGE